MEAVFNVVGVNSGRAFLVHNNVILPQSHVAAHNWDAEINPTRYKPRSQWVYTNVRVIDRHIIDCKLAIMANTPGQWHVPHPPGSFLARRLLWMHDTLYILRKYRTFCSRFSAQMKRASSRESSEGGFFLGSTLGYL